MNEQDSHCEAAGSQRRWPMLSRLLCSLLLASPLLAEPSVLQALPSARLTPYEPAASLAGEFLQRPFTEYFSLHALPGGARLGWCSFALSTPDGGTLRFQETTEYRYKLGSAAFEQRIRESWNFDAKPPYALRSAVRESWLQNKLMKTTLTRTGPGEYRAEITEAGEMRSRDFSNLQLTAMDRLGFRLWAVQAGPQRGDCQAFRGFDLKNLEPFTERHCIALLSGEGGVSEIVSENLKDAFTFRYALLPNGNLAHGVLADATELRPCTAGEARNWDRVEDVFTSSLVRSPRALGAQIKSGQSLTMTLTGPGLKSLPRTAFQKVKWDATGQSATLLTGPKAGAPMPATPEEIKAALTSPLTLPCKDPRIQRMAREACARASTTEAKVRALLKFVSGFVTDDDRIKPLGLISVVKNPRGDCTAHALLFTALARAAGIPCREVSGYLYLSDTAQAFGGHAWNEVVIDGHWHPVDPTWNQFNLDAGHIQLTSGSPTPHDAQYFRGTMRLRME